jgi:hypothetical protein
MTLEQLKKVKLIIASELRLDPDNFQSQLFNITLIRDRYLQLFIQENKELQKLKIKKDERYGELYDDLKFNSPKRWESKSEIEPQIKRDKSFVTILNAIEDQQEVVTYLEQTLDSFKQLSYQIKNHIEWSKFQAGVDR